MWKIIIFAQFCKYVFKGSDDFLKIYHFITFLQVYHKPPTAFVEGTGGLKRVLPTKLGEDSIVAPSQVIAEPSSLIGDLLSMDLGPGKPTGDAAAAGGNVDLLSGEEFCTVFFFWLKLAHCCFTRLNL